MCKWNCERLAAALAPILPAELTSAHVARFDEIYAAEYLGRMRAKLGIRHARPTDDASDAQLIEALLDVMHQSGADFTHTFRALCSLAPNLAPRAESSPSETVEAIVARCASPAVLSAALAKRARDSAPRIPRSQARADELQSRMEAE